MKKFTNSKVTNKGILALVYILNKIRKGLAVTGILAMLWSYVPWQQIQAEIVPKQEATIEEVMQREDSMPNYPTTTDPDFNPSLVEIDSEIEDERTETTKTYRKIDGTYEVAMYNDVIHYLENNKYKQINNSLYDNGNNEFENKDNKFKVKFPKKLDDNKQIKLTMDKYSIDWNVLNIDSSNISFDESDITPNNIKELINVNQSVLYTNIQQNVDIEYILTGSKIKENIILNEYVPNFSLSFEYKLKNLSIIEDKEGNILFINKEGETIFTFDDLFMIDNNMNESFDIQFGLVKTGNKTYEITITPSDKWLQTASYPVNIDPTINSSTQSISMFDTYVSEGNPNTNYCTSNQITIANTSSSSEYRGLIYFNFPYSLMDKEIVHSTLTLTGYNATTGRILGLYKNDSSFTSSTVTWNNRPSHATEMTDYHVVGSDNKFIFDITKTVKEWQATGNTETSGFTIKDKYNYGAYNTVRSLESTTTSYKPVIEFVYIDSSGIKDYWTYNNQYIGVAGTGYISDLTGELNFIKNDLYFGTEKQAFGFSLIYNFDREVSDETYGYGWSTNYSMTANYDATLDQYEVRDGTDNLVYYYRLFSCDSRLTPNSVVTYSCYIAEDGSGNTFVREYVYSSLNSEFILTMDQMKYKFVNDNLTKITDTRTGNDVTIVRDSSNPYIIDYIYDESGNIINLTYSNSKLHSASLQLKQSDTSLNEVERVYYYYAYKSLISRNTLYRSTYQKDYDSSSGLSTDETTYYFSDNYGKLTNVYVSEQEEVMYTYKSGTSKIDTVKMYYNNQIFGEISYDYGVKQTTITDHRNNYIIYKFDNYGHTVNILDNYGNVQSFSYMNLFTYLPDETGVLYLDENPNYINNNHLVTKSDPYKTIDNKIINHSFEIGRDFDTNWELDQTPYYMQNIQSSFECTTSIYGECSARIYASSSTYYGSYEQDVLLDSGSYILSGYIKNDTSTNNVNFSVTNAKWSAALTNVSNDGEWHYVTLQFNVEYDDTYITINLNSSGVGYARFDNVQLIEGFRDTRKNIIDNSSFEELDGSGNFEGWLEVDETEITRQLNSSYATDLEEDILGTYSIRIDGDATDLRYAWNGFTNYLNQDVVDGKLIIGGWAYSESTPISRQTTDTYNEVFRIKVDILSSPASIGTPNYDTYLISTNYIDFDTSIEGWQYKLEEVTYEAGNFVYISLEYQGEGFVLFDQLQMYYEGINSMYEYNIQGNLVTSMSSSNDITKFIYGNTYDSRPTEITTQNGTVQLGIDDESAMVESVVFNNVTSTILYNTYGQPYSITIGEGNDYFTTSTAYLSSGFSQYISSTTNEYGKTTDYYTDTLTGLLTAIENANNDDLYFEYDNEGKLIKAVHVDNYATYDNGDPYYAKIVYHYNSQDQLNQIEFDDDYSYFLVYDTQGRISEVKVNNNSLMSYVYESDGSYNTNRLSTQTYGNGDVIKFDYTDENQIEQVSFSEDGTNFNVKFSYEYDQSGLLAVYNTHDDNGNIEKTEYYTYDTAGRLIKMVDNFNNEINYIYDSQGSMIGLDFVIDGENQFVEYLNNKCMLWDQNDSSNCLETSTFYDMTKYETQETDEIEKEYLYESGALKRLQYIELMMNDSDFITTNFNYYGDTTRLNSITYTIDSDSITYKYSYVYDNVGNITSYRYYEGTTIIHARYYEYDELNQLHVEDVYDNDSQCVSNKTCYTKYYYYDKNGNITDIKTFLYGQNDYTTVSIPSFYENSYGMFDCEMHYNTTKDYQDIYPLNVGQSPSLSFSYYDPDNEVWVSNMTTSMTSGNLDTSTEGYYYRSYTASDPRFYDIDFKIVFKVGNPTGGYTIPQEHIKYNYSGNWEDQLVNYQSLTYNSSGNVTSTTTEQTYTYDNQGNPTRITNFYYEGTYYYEALLEWDGRQLTGIFVDDVYSQSNNYLDESDFSSSTDAIFTSSSILVKPNTAYLFYIPDYFGNTTFLITGNNGTYINESTSMPDLCYSTGGKLACPLITGNYETELNITVSASEIDQYLYYLGLDDIQLQEGWTLLPHEDYLEPDSHTISYTYNDQGYRTSKTLDGTTISYTLIGDKVIYETDGTYVIMYTYDIDGTIISFNLNDDTSSAEYFYIKNQQGDITKIVNSSGDYTIRKSLSKIIGLPALNFLKTGGVEMYNMVGDILFTGYGNKFESYVPKVGYALAGAQTGWVAGRTFVSMTDTEYCFDYAESLGWRPYED